MPTPLGRRSQLWLWRDCWIATPRFGAPVGEKRALPSVARFSPARARPCIALPFGLASSQATRAEGAQRRCTSRGLCNSGSHLRSARRSATAGRFQIGPFALVLLSQGRLLVLRTQKAPLPTGAPVGSASRERSEFPEVTPCTWLRWARPAHCSGSDRFGSDRAFGALGARLRPWQASGAWYWRR